MLMMIPAILLIALLAAIALGGPRGIAPLASVNSPPCVPHRLNFTMLPKK